MSYNRHVVWQINYSFFIPLILSIVSQGLFAQGILDGYMKGKGKLDIAISYAFEESNEYYKGIELSSVLTTVNSGGVFAAYGISDDFDMLFSAPYVTINDAGGLQDGGLYGRYKVLEKVKNKSTSRWMIGGGVNTPLSNYELDSLGAVGLQVTSFDARSIFQYENSGAFIQFQTGFIWRYDFFNDGITHEVPNFFPISLKVGGASASTYFDIWLDIIAPIGGLDDNNINRPPLQTFATAYTKVGGTLYFTISDSFGIVVNAATTLNGRNTIKSTRGGIGLIFKFNFIQISNSPDSFQP